MSWVLRVCWCYLTYLWLRVTHEIVVCIFFTFDNNFEIENDFTKYLKESI